MQYKLFPSFYDLKRVKYINSQIKKHLLRRRDSPAGHATKTSTVKVVEIIFLFPRLSVAEITIL